MCVCIYICVIVYKCVCVCRCGCVCVYMILISTSLHVQHIMHPTVGLHTTDHVAISQKATGFGQGGPCNQAPQDGTVDGWMD